MANIKVGDMVRIKDRSDWWLPTPFRPANAEGKVIDIFDDVGGTYYVAVVFNKEIVGVDERIPLGFRVEDVEKI